MSTKSYRRDKETSVPKVEEKKLETELLKKERFGVVANCTTLNVRKGPSVESDVVSSIKCLTKVAIDEENSANDFYKISVTLSGSDSVIEGYCMKKYIV